MPVKLGGGVTDVRRDEFGALADISAERTNFKGKRSTKILGQRSKLDYCQNIENKINPIVQMKKQVLACVF